MRTYADGEEALAALVRQPADLVILDIKMPRMDGLELLNRLRRTSGVPAIFLTSKDDEIDEVLGLKMGADDYIRKPFSQRLLVETHSQCPAPGGGAGARRGRRRRRQGGHHARPPGPRSRAPRM